MNKFIILLWLFFCLSLFGIERGPWLPSLWEGELQVGYVYTHTSKVASPLGSFSYVNNYHNPFLTYEMTLWPTLAIQSYLGFVGSKDLPFSYESFSLRVRKQWLDEYAGDFCTVTLASLFSFPGSRLLHNFNYPFHGYINGEAEVLIGKEWHYDRRCWTLLGLGIAERGSPWFHGRAAVEYSFCKSHITLFTDWLYGFGHNAVIPFSPFPGYALIRHQKIDGGLICDFAWNSATLSLLAFVNLYAQNFVQNSYGFSLSITVPFGFF